MIQPAPRRDPLPAILQSWFSNCGRASVPLPDWNMLRLSPTSMIRFGAEAYPGLHDGT